MIIRKVSLESSISREFLSFAKFAIPESAEKKQVFGMKMAFFSGALVALSLQNAILAAQESGQLSAEETETRINQLDNEAPSFYFDFFRQVEDPLLPVKILSDDELEKAISQHGKEERKLVSELLSVVVAIAKAVKNNREEDKDQEGVSALAEALKNKHYLPKEEGE